MINDGRRTITFLALLVKKHLNLKCAKLDGEFQPPCAQVHGRLKASHPHPCCAKRHTLLGLVTLAAPLFPTECGLPQLCKLDTLNDANTCRH